MAPPAKLVGRGAARSDPGGIPNLYPATSLLERGAPSSGALARLLMALEAKILVTLHSRRHYLWPGRYFLPRE